MKLLRRRPEPEPRTRSFRPAERYLAAGTEEARRLGHGFVATEHVLLVLIRDPGGDASCILGRLGVTTAAVEAALAPCAGPSARGIDPEALAALGIDFETVRQRLEESFGPGALEDTQAGCLGVAPRLKRALAFAVDHAAGGPVTDVQVLLGLLSVPESLAAHVLGQLGVSFEAVEASASG